MADALNPALAFVAGGLTILSPCVLPLVPIVFGSAAQRHRFGPLALSIGLVVTFTVAGFLLATLGFAAGFDGEIVRMAAAAILLVAAVFLLVPQAQTLLTRLATPLAGWASARQEGLEKYGLAGQAAIGALLGLVWTPCVGPTLGAAIALAAEGKSLGAVALTMLAFGTGIATVLLLVATIAQQFFRRKRSSIMSGGDRGKKVFGALIAIVAVMILTGVDHLAEGYLVEASPDWLIDLTTSA